MSDKFCPSCNIRSYTSGQCHACGEPIMTNPIQNGNSSNSNLSRITCSCVEPITTCCTRCSQATRDCKCDEPMGYGALDDLIELFKSKIRSNVPPISTVKDQSNRIWKQAIDIITQNRTRLEADSSLHMLNGVKFQECLPDICASKPKDVYWLDWLIQKTKHMREKLQEHACASSYRCDGGVIIYEDKSDDSRTSSRTCKYRGTQKPQVLRFEVEKRTGVMTIYKIKFADPGLQMELRIRGDRFPLKVAVMERCEKIAKLLGLQAEFVGEGE